MKIQINIFKDFLKIYIIQNDAKLQAFCTQIKYSFQYSNLNIKLYDNTITFLLISIKSEFLFYSPHIQTQASASPWCG